MIAPIQILWLGFTIAIVPITLWVNHLRCEAIKRVDALVKEMIREPMELVQEYIKGCQERLTYHLENTPELAVLITELRQQIIMLESIYGGEMYD